MKYVLAAAALVPPALLVIGSWRGKIKVRGCCSVEARHDLRMRSAFPELEAAPPAAAPERASADRPS